MLWLAASIVHHANRVRPNPSGVKVGGHQASSASMVSLMTALYFAVLEAPDRVSVKPHASPVLHAINHLLGRLDATLPHDAAPVRRPAVLPVAHEGPGPGRLLHRVRRPRRHRADLGRARPPLRRGPLRRRPRRPPDRADRRRRTRRGRVLGGDRRPDGGAPRRGDVGRRPQPPVARPRRPRHRRGPPRRDVRGRGLAHRDGQVRPAPRADGPTCAPASTRCPTRSTSGSCAPTRPTCAAASRCTPTTSSDEDLLATFRDLGGHDLAGLIDGYRQADAVKDRPSVVFAYTIKGWSLPTEGHPANHSALLNHAQYRELAAKLGEDADDPFQPLDGAAGELCRTVGERLRRERDAGGARADAPARPRPQAHRHSEHPAGVRALLRRPDPRSAGGGRRASSP